MLTPSISRGAGRRLLVALQVMLIVATLFSPVPAAAADDPSADPSPTPSAEPTPAPDATPSPEPITSPEPSPAPTPTPTPAYAPSGPPSIDSDQADYPPGGMVTLSGSNWQPGEVVHIYVNDDWGSSWSRNVDVIADAGGEIQDQFNLPDWFVATYTVVATGEQSGTAVTSFTDGNVKVFSQSGRHFNFSVQLFTTSTDCSTGGSSITTQTADGNGATTGVGNNQSTRIIANLNANAPNGSSTFSHWLNPDGLTITPNLTTRTICVVGFQSGSRDLIGVYTAANAAPVANDDAYSVAEDGTLTVVAPGVLTNDTDADSNPLTVGTPRPASGPSNGTLTLNTNGSFTYVPNANFSGSDSFTYWANDGTANSATTATVTITVTPVDDAPAAVDDSATVAEDSGATSIDVLANDTDIDGGPMTVASVTQPANGAVVITGGGTGVSYEPNADYCNGGSPTDDFSYTLNGGSTATVEVTVTCVNDDPVANDDVVLATEDTPVSIPAATLLSNDTDVDGGTLSISAVGNATNGSVVLELDGSVTFAPAADVCGIGAASFEYTANDGNGGTDVGVVTVDITCVDDLPEAVDDSATVGEDAIAFTIDVLTNDTDVDGGPMSVGSVTQPANGTVVNNGTDVTYTPDADYCNDGSPTDDFNYTLNGGSTAAVSVTVTCLNDNPVATDDLVLATEDTALSIDAATLLGNDTDVDGDSLTISAVGSANNGSVVLELDGSVTFTPAADVCGVGAASFDYTVDDGNGGTDIGAVTLNIICVDDAPAAVDDSATVAEDSGATSIDVLANDTDIDGGPMTVASVTQPANGAVVITGGGTGVSYEPNADYCNGGSPTDDFSYTLNGGSTATVEVTVTCVNDDPVANDDSATVAEDSPATSIDVLANDNDGPDSGETLSVAAVTDPANGTVTFTAGDVSYTPDPDYYGPDAFTYTISDGNGGTAVATVSVTVTEVNDTPVAVDDDATVAEDDPFTTIDVKANDSTGPANESGQSLSVTAVSDPANGTALVVDPGTPTNTADDYVQYTPDADYNGADSFTYTVCDDGTTNAIADPKCDTATVSITVTEVNDAPIAGDDSDTVAEDSSVTTLVLANDSTGPANENTQTLTVTLVTQGANGSVTTNGTTVTYTPDADYNGADSFTYTVCDDGTTDGVLDAKCDTATVSITVTEVNDAPIAGDDSDTVAEDSSVTTSVLTDDVAGPANENTQTLTVSSVTQGANGSTSTDGTTVTYTPDADYNGPDSFTYTVCDDGTTDGVLDAKCDTATVSITVTEVNDAPVIASIVADPASITENDSSTVTVTFQDAEAGQSHTCVFAWDDGGTMTVTVGAGVTTCAATHQYLDDDPSGTASDAYTVSVSVTDNGTTNGSPDPKSDTGSTSVQVNNAAPVITSITGPAGPQAKGTPSTVSASYTDVGSQDTHSCTFSWDDGTFSIVAGSGGTCSATHTYVAAGVYTVAVTVTDDDTGSDTETMGTFIVIFDPGAGFVTGGGWINVTAGSCRLTPVCEGAAGKANFGFVSKYKKGASIPDGQTEFQFQAGNLNFHSEAYEWLVVTGNKAQYRGTGRINGTTGYRFLLTAYDQSPDKFRIKIWRTSTNDVVFDSRMGQSDDIDAASPQGIAGGSIVIHK